MKKIALLLLVVVLLAVPASGWTWKARTETDTAAGFCGAVTAADSAGKVGPLTDTTLRGLTGICDNIAVTDVVILTTGITATDTLGVSIWIWYGIMNGAVSPAYNPLAAGSMRLPYTSVIDRDEDGGGRGFSLTYPGVGTGDSVRFFWKIERLK